MRKRDVLVTPVRVASSEGGTTKSVAVYRCKQEWNELKETAHPEVRFCDECSRSVFRVRTYEGFLELVASDKCACVDDGELIVGAPARHLEDSAKLEWQDDDK